MVQMNTPITLRFRFRKVGSLMYISHLDLVRTFSKIVIRSGLPLWFTEGFNPKPKMVFSVPLSVGVESETEYLDLRLTERVDVSYALAQMNKNVTDELRMLEAYYPEEKLSALCWLSYTMDIYTPNVDAQLAAAAEATLTASHVMVPKKGSGENDPPIDIRDRIHDLHVTAENDRLHIDAVLCADQARFLNPDLLIGKLKSVYGILPGNDLLHEYTKIVRLHAYREDMSDFR